MDRPDIGTTALDLTAHAPKWRQRRPLSAFARQAVSGDAHPHGAR
jgi:hypothetical protein